MTCAYCGKDNVTWDGFAAEGKRSFCPDCGRFNCAPGGESVEGVRIPPEGGTATKVAERRTEDVVANTPMEVMRQHYSVVDNEKARDAAQLLLDSVVFGFRQDGDETAVILYIPEPDDELQPFVSVDVTGLLPHVLQKWLGENGSCTFAAPGCPTVEISVRTVEGMDG